MPILHPFPTKKKPKNDILRKQEIYRILCINFNNSKKICESFVSHSNYFLAIIRLTIFLYNDFKDLFLNIIFI